MASKVFLDEKKIIVIDRFPFSALLNLPRHLSGLSLIDVFRNKEINFSLTHRGVFLSKPFISHKFTLM